jgi:hypothetical protein
MVMISIAIMQNGQTPTYYILYVTKGQLREGRAIIGPAFFIYRSEK